MTTLPRTITALVLLFAATIIAAEWKIAIAPDAPVAEMTAATELQKELKALFGKELPIVKGNPASPAIRLGTSADNAQRLGVDFAKLKYDEIILKTIDGDVVLAGSRPRGTLYAIYEYLERYYGVRFWTATETTYPKQDFRIAKPDYRFAPPLRHRYYYSDIIHRNKLFAVKMRNNWACNLPEELGGSETISGWCHTFNLFLPAEKYFAKHPEYYAMRDGVRQDNGSRSQLCLTNKEMTRELIKNVLDHVHKKAGQITDLAISQNDSQSYCTCPNCEKFVKEHGNQTDLLLHVVNQVADAVKEVDPNIRVVTLAYNYTRFLPKTIMPRDNVIIHLCSIECRFTSPMESEDNANFAEQVRGWGKIAKQLYIWNYVTNFHGFHLPHPNFNPIAQDIRFFIKNHASAIFEQGAHGLGEAGDMTWLRAYLYSKLMWNPDLDQDKLTREFLNGYYGKAGLYLYDYMQLVNTAREESVPGLGCYAANANWFKPNRIKEAYAIFQKAFAAVKDDPVLTERVDFAMFSLKALLLTRPQVLKELMPDKTPLQLVDELIATAKKSGAHRHTEEYSSLNAWRKIVEEGAIRKQNGKKPDFVQDDQIWFDVPLCTQQRLEAKTNWYSCVDDAQASIGKAIKLPTTHPQWCIQDNKLPAEEAYDIYLAVRCPKDNGPDRKLLEVGLYPGDLKKVVCRRYSAKDMETADGTYRYVKFTRLPQDYAGLLYICPIDQSKNHPTEVYLDRVIFVKPK